LALRHNDFALGVHGPCTDDSKHFNTNRQDTSFMISRM